MTLGLVLAGLGVLAMGGLVLVARSWGGERKMRQVAEERLDATADMREIENDVDAMDDAERRDALDEFVRRR